jgi:hypothetical protein
MKALVAFICLLTSSVLAQGPGKPVSVEMRNVLYHFTNNVAVHIRSLQGQLVPKGDLPVFDDKQSFTLDISSAEIAMSPDNLANVLNSYVFARNDAPLRGISVAIEKDKLQIKGKLHSKGDIPLEAEGSLSSTPDGKIRLHTEKIKALHLPAKGLMDLLGVDIADLVKTGKVQGVSIDKDDMLLDPAGLLPPPHISAKVTSVRLENNLMVQIMGTGGAANAKSETSGNDMAYRGNQLRFGKLTMSDTDLILIDLDPRDPFDFYLDHYKEQLVAGYTKETMSFGLRVYMRDYNKLHPRKSASASTKH